MIVSWNTPCLGHALIFHSRFQHHAFIKLLNHREVWGKWLSRVQPHPDRSKVAAYPATSEASRTNAKTAAGKH